MMLMVGNKTLHCSVWTTHGKAGYGAEHRLQWPRQIRTPMEVT